MVWGWLRDGLVLVWFVLARGGGEYRAVGVGFALRSI